MDSLANLLSCKQDILKKQRPIDDLMFSLCAKHNSFCREMLSVILDNADLTVEENTVQYYLTNPGRRSVILDAKCRLGDGSLVNIEVQTGDKLNHQKRVRLHAALMTAEAGWPQMEFAELPNVCTVYICEFDIFGHNAPIYKVDRVLRGFGEVLDNGYTEIYINAKVRDDSKISRLMELFVERGVYNYAEFGEVSRVKNYFINTEEGQKEMDSILDDLLLENYERIRAEAKKEGRAEGVAEGKKEGRAEGIISTFINLVKEGVFTVAEACKRADISEENFKAFMDKYDKEQARIQPG